MTQATYKYKYGHGYKAFTLEKEQKLAKDLLFEAVDDVDEAIALAEKYVGEDYKIILMPQGSLTVPVLKK
ncbi:MAG: hypothetical protein Q4E64_00775 [Phascolarctobacterium sp.]|uniref:hypothetical protein n=1 Tax=Phascolarctobacterium sp. TaxID=2049039 RepID=UPI0026DCAA6F|nr:hypothetical protein [Phascolarctobacterium sp.]MDO4920353.1 hypothetical protein [Phascolarctobacterium sp.]